MVFLGFVRFYSWVRMVYWFVVDAAEDHADILVEMADLVEVFRSKMRGRLFNGIRVGVPRLMRLARLLMLNRLVAQRALREIGSSNLCSFAGG
jgi:hypothetical protein